MLKANGFYIIFIIIILLLTPMNTLETQTQYTPQLAIVYVNDSQSSPNSDGLFNYLNFSIHIYDNYSFGIILSYSLFALNSQNQPSHLVLHSTASLNPDYETGINNFNLPFSCNLFFNSSATPRDFELDLNVQ